MRLAIIGSGYVGLVSGACFADLGHDVCCVDKAHDKIEQLQAGRIPIFEPGLDDLVARNAAAGRLSFSTDLASAVASADAVFIAVGTPARPVDGHADLSFVFEAAREIAVNLNGFTAIVMKSTVPVGTGDEIERIIVETNPAAEISVVSNPEFLRQGAAIGDFLQPDRIVVGVEDARARAVMADIYRVQAESGVPVLFTGRHTSELIKYAANAFLAMKITYINEIADLCERVDANVHEVARGIGLDNRIGMKFLNAGPGIGGSCFPKDTLALVKTARDAGASIRLIETTVDVNNQRKRAMGRKIAFACGGNMRGKTVAILGLTFKANTDDMRDSPSISIIQALVDMGARVKAYDPEGMEQARRVLPAGVEYAGNIYAAARGAHALAIVTEWDEFRTLDFRRLKEEMASPVFVDLRNLHDGDTVERHGFSYTGIGEARTPRLVSARLAAE